MWGWRRWALVGRVRRPWRWSWQVAVILVGSVVAYLVLGRLVLR